MNPRDEHTETFKNGFLSGFLHVSWTHAEEKLCTYFQVVKYWCSWLTSKSI